MANKGPSSSSLANQTGRVPPHNEEAERSVLGAILVQNQTIDQVREVGLEAQDFYFDAHRKIYEVACHLADRNEPVDLVTLTAALKDRDWYEAIGGTSQLTRLFDDAFALGNVGHYAQIVRNKAIQRRMVEACSQIITQAFEGVEDNETFLDEAERSIFSVAQKSVSKSFTPLRQVLLDNMASIEQLAIKSEDVTGVETGFTDFDKLTTGLHPGQTVIIAARPGMGKTSWLLSAIQHASVVNSQVVGIFSLEMAKEELGFRLLSGLSRIDSKRIKVGRLSDHDWGKLSEAADHLARSKIFIDDTGGLSVMDIRARCRRLLSVEGQLDMIVVDYLQLMQGQKNRGDSSREREISEISRGLKELAKELKVPVIALSQLNRSVESRQDKRPTLADLRESGAIEQDADIVCFIHREDYYDKESENQGIAELIVAKNRSGDTGNVRLAWIGRYTLFANLAEGEEGAPVQSSRPDKGDVVL